MSIFDKFNNESQPTTHFVEPQKIGTRSETFIFSALPESVEEMKALPEASLDTPFKTAALTVCALCAYAADRNIGIDILNFLRGPRPLGGADISFLNDRFRDGKIYIPFSYFHGSSPENDYSPSRPFTVTVKSDHTTDAEIGYAKLFIPCSGADSPRPVKLRMKGDGTWLLWEQYLLTGIRQPHSSDSWA